jgi:alpha-glucosidase
MRRQESSVLKSLIIATLMLLCLAPTSVLAADDLVVASPDGAVRFKLLLSQPRISFTVTKQDLTIIEPSSYVLTIDGVDLGDGAQVGEIQKFLTNETYATRGVHSQAIDRSNGAKIQFRAKDNTPFVLEARAYDSGVAFRTIVNGDANQRRVPDEMTVFKIPGGSAVWSHNLRGHYEGTYESTTAAKFRNGQWAAVPMTFRLPDKAAYASITEANLLNYSGMTLQGDGKSGFTIGLAHRAPVSYPYELRYSKEDIQRLSRPAVVTGTITTPWRVVLVGDLNTLVNSDIITNLCAPPDPKLFPKGVATDWVRPGRGVWRYLDNPTETRGDPGADAGTRREGQRAQPRPAASQPSTRPGGGDGPQVTLEEAKKWSEWASELGFEFNVLEGFWRRFSDEQLRELVEYSRQKNVGLYVWKHSKELRDPEARHKFLQFCHDFGITGAKIDFFDHEHKEVIDLYLALLKEGAALHVQFDFHGANKPTGLERTYPNEMIREAVRGMEARSLTERAAHETILPFTRLLAGPAEYTGLIFNQRRGDTSVAHQIAVPFILYGPLLTVAAHPEKLLESPAVDMIKSLPAVWDETIVLQQSEIGEMALMARRSGKSWFLVCLNGPAAKSVDVPLSFLGNDIYQMLLVKDGRDDAPQPPPTNSPTTRPGVTPIAIDRSPMKGTDHIKLDLTPGGGFVARFTP